MQIEVHSSKQELIVIQNQHCLRAYPIQTSRYGLGNIKDSYQTPTGMHHIVEKIGQHSHPYTVFKARLPEQELYSPKRYHNEPNKDWILARILWLQGLESGINLGGECDSMNRYIYIHGAPELAFEQETGSCGCIRMMPKDMIELFDLVDVHTLVYIRS